MSVSEHMTHSRTRNDFHATSTLPNSEGDLCQPQFKVQVKKDTTINLHYFIFLGTLKLEFNIHFNITQKCI